MLSDILEIILRNIISKRRQSSWIWASSTSCSQKGAKYLAAAFGLILLDCIVLWLS